MHRDVDTSVLKKDLFNALFALPENPIYFGRAFHSIATTCAQPLRALLPELLHGFLFKLSEAEVSSLRKNISEIGKATKLWYQSSLKQQSDLVHRLQKLSQIIPPSSFKSSDWPTDDLVQITHA